MTRVFCLLAILAVAGCTALIVQHQDRTFAVRVLTVKF